MDLQEFRQRNNKELERALKDANPMILALSARMEVAEGALKILVRKKRGTKWP